ncbi:hypothetical protein BBJ28_00021841 [Nothophytophthora sp. Chile5]|nr:hypothetical protein BBJ28_00021841 [Nothophytophthora sp. Chile5]
MGEHETKEATAAAAASAPPPAQPAQPNASAEVPALANAMAEDDKTQKEADENDDEGDEVFTLSDMLKQNEQLTDTADAVLGDASDTHCSHAMGYFRQTNKAPTNPRNVYSQNYGGRYCNCHRPFPDPERTAPEVMVQCVICEDWLHEEHISAGLSSADEAKPVAIAASPSAGSDSASSKTDTTSAPAGDAVVAPTSSNIVSPDQFDELICLDCMKKHPFLLAYTLEDPATEEVEGEEAGDKVEEKHPIECALKAKQQQLEAEGGTTLRPTFWPHEWRENLCQCSTCVALLEKHGIAFLMDPEDTLHAYEANGRERKRASDEEQAQHAMASTLSHEQQVEVAIGYNHMKNSLQQYLAGFAAGGKVVRPQDIESFFEELKQRKRQKTEL